MGSATAPECAAVRIEARRTGPDRPGKVDPRRCLPGSSNPYATFNQGGNVWHWNEQIVNSPVFAARAAVRFLKSWLSVAVPRMAAPHSSQNLALGRNSAPQLAQQCPSGVAHSSQNFAPARFS
jgi:hypothetical protein